MGAIDVGELTGASPKDIIKKYGGVQADEHLSKKKRSTYNWRLQNNQTTGDMEAISLICRDVLSKPEVTTAHTNELYSGIVQMGLERRQKSQTAQIYNAEGLFVSIAEELGIEEVAIRNIIQGLRTSGAYLLTGTDSAHFTPAFQDAYDEFRHDYMSKSPSSQKFVVPKDLESPLDWYRQIQDKQRITATFAPYELDYWNSILISKGDALLPFSRKVLDYYATARTLDMQADEGIITTVRNETYIPVDRHTFEHTLKLLSSDFPTMENFLSVEV